MPPTNKDCENFITPPEYYLQTTASGEVRGVTHDYEEHAEYFSVTADHSDVAFLKAFSTHYPQAKPTLPALLDYRKYRMSKWKELVDQEKENILDDD